MSKHLSIAVIGEINLDVISRLETVSLRELTENLLVHAPVQTRLGGVGGSFALAAVQRFTDVNLLSAVGCDIVGDVITDLLKGTSIRTVVRRDPTIPSRTVMILHDRADGVTSGTRLIVTSAKSPSDNLDPSDLELFHSNLSTCQALFVPGYQLLCEPTRSTCLSAMQFCRQRGCEVAVDLVPHDLYDRLSLSELQQLTNDSTIIISEVQTLNGFTTGHQSGILNLKDALASSSNIRHLLPNRWLLLKFGIGNMDQFLVVSPAGKACSGYTGFRDLSDTTGFGDRVTAKELYLILTSGIEGWAEPKIDLNREHNIP